MIAAATTWVALSTRSFANADRGIGGFMAISTPCMEEFKLDKGRVA